MISDTVSVPKLSLPKGGGALTGIGETFQPNSFTGTAGLSIPIHASPCRGFEPHLSLDYSSGSGNGIFGMGFSLAIPNISRKTEKGFPRYDDTDTFLISNSDDLVPRLIKKEKGDEWERPVAAFRSENRDNYSITQYRPRTEGLFARIEKWVNSADRVIHWRVTTKDNITSIYGKDRNARIADPKDESRVFQWLLNETRDAKGNRIRYEYQAEDTQGLVGGAYKANSSLTANRYIHKIKYGNYPAGKSDGWQFELVFDYGERPAGKPDQLPEPAQLTYEANAIRTLRQDPFLSCRAGFEICTQWLCRKILLFHRFGDDAPFLVHGTHLDYTETPSLSLLTKVTQVGYRKDNGVIRSKPMPPLDLKYSEPEYGPCFKRLTRASVNGDSSELHQRIDELVDLYGDGLPGILHSDDQTTHYSRPLGDGIYAAAREPAHFPIDRNLEGGQYTLLDLGGDGELDLVAQSPSGSGYFQSEPEKVTWKPYRAFPAYPTDIFSRDRQMVDVTGDGLADLVMFESNAVKVYRSRGKDGFAPATVQLRKDDDLPLTCHGSAVEYVGFTDLIGDGGNHLVRIRSGSVECWPHLGYGRFGEKVVLDNAPGFGGQLDPSRLFLADIDGSGTTDLVYAYHDHLEIYRNQSGNGFAARPELLPLPHGYDNLDHIRFADVLGNGTACLILTSRDPDLRLRHEYFDFNAAGKPHLLIGIDNHMGAEKKIHYAASTRFYLDDLKAGRPWATRLSFPVQVIERVEVIDHIACSRLVTRYAYHDGHYDREEREFRGFGYVEQWDSESHEEQRQWIEAHKEKGTLAFPLGVDEDSASYVAPVYTRSWFHTGDTFKVAESVQLSSHYQDYYYDGDPDTGHLPDSRLDKATFDPQPETINEACRALHGHKLREEIYGLDQQQNPGLVKHPYAVTESNFKVRLLQPMAGQKHAVCFVHPSEEISWHYERNPKDPRIEHSFTLQVDDYGHVLNSCQVFYPRRKALDEGDLAQCEPKAIAAIRRFGKPIDTETNYLVGVLGEEQTFELVIGQEAFVKAGLLTLASMEGRLHDVDGDAIPSLPPPRLLTWERHYFWDKEHKKGVLSFSEGDDTESQRHPEIAPQELHHHTESAIFPVGRVQEIYADKVNDAILVEARYFTKEGYWWNPGLIQHFAGADDLFLPTKTVDPFESCTQVTYDQYNLVPVTVIDALGNITQADIDYHTLQPSRVTDINGNTSQVLFDPLGMVIATSVYGMENDSPKGDLPLVSFEVHDLSGDDVVSNARDILQQATSCFCYELGFVANQPPHSVTLQREMHVHDLKAEDETEIQVHISYSDGFGRALQTKVKAGSGLALGLDKNGNLVEETSEVRWLTSGRTVYNNKGKPVKQYEPFYTATRKYIAEPKLNQQGVTHRTHYDPLRRVVRVDTPDKLFSKVEFTPWEETHFDENDTVKNSPFWIANNGIPRLEPDVRDALNKAEQHHNTPETHLLDTQGRTYQIIRQLDNSNELEKLDVSNKLNELVTQYELDIQGHELSSTDPRLYRLNAREKTSHRSFRHKYAMHGAVLWTWSADAGERWVLHDALGSLVHIWDSRGFRISTRHDALQRPVEVHVKGDDRKGLVLDQVVERMVYGEGDADDTKLNLRGRLVRHYDQAGAVHFDRYDIKGELLKSRRRLRKDYKQEANWPESGGEELFEDERFEANWERDALGRVIRETHPDGSRIRQTYHREGTLNEIEVTFSDGRIERIVDGIRYNSKGQRTAIRYGNRVESTFEYDPRTFRLKTLKSERSGTGNPANAETAASLQNIDYTYDPVGNITRIRDHSHETVFASKQEVKPLCDYSYDALYRLIAATGREHPALAGNEYQSNAKEAFKQSRFLNLNDRRQLRWYQESYTYDPGGNLTRIQHHTAQPDGSWTREIAVAETSNRAVSSKPAPDPTTVDDFFDLHGNQTSLENVSGNIRWNCRDNIAGVDLIRRESQPFDAEYYVYDAGGRRIRKVSETLKAGGIVEIAETIYLGGVEIKRVKQKESNVLKMTSERWSLHVSDGHERIAIAHHWRAGKKEGETQLRYQLGNHLGSASLELTENAEIISYEEYFPYGGTAFIAGKDKTEVRRKSYRYSGKERDDSTGLYYYGARYYAPWLGRWMSPDPAGEVDGLNLYAFLSGNPIGFIDPTGLCKKDKQKSRPNVHHAGSESRAKGGRLKEPEKPVTGTETGKPSAAQISTEKPVKPGKKRQPKKRQPKKERSAKEMFQIKAAATPPPETLSEKLHVEVGTGEFDKFRRSRGQGKGSDNNGRFSKIPEFINQKSAQRHQRAFKDDLAKAKDEIDYGMVVGSKVAPRTDISAMIQNAVQQHDNIFASVPRDPRSLAVARELLSMHMEEADKMVEHTQSRTARIGNKPGRQSVFTADSASNKEVLEQVSVYRLGAGVVKAAPSLLGFLK